MNRADLQRLADERAADAAALLAAGRWSGAYYLAGYAAECALKACVAKMVGLHDFPDKEFAQKAYTHNLPALVTLLKLDRQLKADAAADAAFGLHWDTARDWTEQSRYKLWSEAEARKLFAAVTDPNHGVLQWIKSRW